MTLQEALQTDEVKALLSNLIRESLAEALTGDALTEAVAPLVETKIGDLLQAKLPELRESLAGNSAKNGQLRALNSEAVRLIDDAAWLKGAAKAGLLADYGIVESTDADDDAVKPGRGLALIEAEVDDDGKVTKPAKDVLREAIDEDLKRVRNVLRESAPTVPVALGGGGGGDAGAITEAAFLPDDSPVTQRFRTAGLDPAQFGATPKPEPAKA